MSQQKLKDTIDKMVAESIRRLLPQVMNEVLLQTIANSGVIRESAPPVRQAPQRQAAPTPVRKKGRPSSLNDILDESAGAEFYGPGTDQAIHEEVEPETPPRQPLAQRIQALPPELRGLAEGVTLDDDPGEMWDSELGDSAPVSHGPPLERAASAVGLDFSKMRQAIKITEKKAPGPSANERAAKVQFEEMRLQRLRERLNDGKPVT